MQDFEKTFGEFIDSLLYDKAENDLFSMVRFSFTAGWIAAGGDPPQPGKFVTMMRNILLYDSPDSIETDSIMN
jgi:hypothetical protein